MLTIHVLPRRLKEFLLTHPLYKSPISVAVNNLKAEGKIETVDEKVRKGNRDWIVTYYKVIGGWWMVDGDW